MRACVTKQLQRYGCAEDGPVVRNRLYGLPLAVMLGSVHISLFSTGLVQLRGVRCAGRTGMGSVAIKRR